MQPARGDAFAKIMQQQRLLSSSDSFVLAHSQASGWRWWWFSSSSPGHAASIQAVLQQHMQAERPTPEPHKAPAVLTPPPEGFVKSSQLLQPSPLPPSAASQSGSLQAVSQSQTPATPALQDAHQIAWTSTVAGVIRPSAVADCMSRG